MSHLLETLGRGWLNRLSDAFRMQLSIRNFPPLSNLLEASRREPERADVRLRLGIRYLAEGDPGRACDCLRNALRLRPGDPLAHIALACALDESGHGAEALAELAAAAEIEPDDATLWFAMGFCHERQAQPKEAVSCYRKALEVNGEFRDAHERLAAIALHDDRIEDAVGHYEHLTRADPGNIDFLLLLANLHLRAGHPEKAAETYENAIVLEPDNWQAHHEKVAALEKAGQLHEAIRQLHEVARREPGFADTELKLGDLYAKVGNAEASLKHYKRALDIHPDYLEATVKIGTHYLRGARHLDAAAWFNRAVQINDRLLIGYVGLGIAQYEAGRIDEAMTSLDLAASIEPNTTLLFSEMARLQLKAAVQQEFDQHFGIDADADAAPDEQSPVVGDLIEQQIERHEDAIREHPDHADLHYRLGLLLRHQGRIDEAVAAFREAVAINPVYVKALVKLGLALKELDQSDEAIRVLQQALDCKPEYVDLHYRLGCLFAERRHFELAVDHFERCVATNPQNREFRANLALALEGMGLIDKAAAAWQGLAEITTQVTAGAGRDP